MSGIWTAAMEMLAGESGAGSCRKPEIMSDAAYVMLSRDPRNYTGNFAIDDDVLREVGVTNFDDYAMVPGKFFIKNTPLSCLYSNKSAYNLRKILIFKKICRDQICESVFK